MEIDYLYNRTKTLKLNGFLPLSMLLMCADFTPIISANCSCVKFCFFLAFRILFPIG